MNIWQFSQRFAWPLWRWYLAGIVFLAASNLITLEIPQLAKDIINAIKSERLSDDSSRLALWIICFGLLQIIVRSFSRILIFWPGRKIEETSKSYVFRRIMQLPQTFFDRFGMGDLISRISNDIGQIRVFFAFAILQIMNLLFIAVFTIVKMLSVHIGLTLICLAPIALMLILTRYLMPMLTRFSRDNQDAIGRLTNRVTESFTNIHILKANAAEKTFLDRTLIENEAVYTTNMKVITFRTLFFPLLTSLTGLSQLLVLGYGGLQVIKGSITVGDILAFNIYLSYLAFPLTSIGIVLSIYQRSKTALQRLTPLVNHPTENSQASAEGLKTTNPPLLTVKELTYSYPTDHETPQIQREQVLDRISFEIREGQRIGICGPVGSGKSTLLRLITRIYDPPPATIFWKGHDILSLEPHELRQKIGFALQEVHLFSDSIRNNIVFGLEEMPSDARVREATDHAQILEEILAFDQEWETQIGEKGVRLSGGQKQRLSLARIFIRDLELLLLDDILSAVDNQTEARLIRYIEQSKRSILISSHRSSVLKSCDFVLFLANGKMIDCAPYHILCERYPEIREDQHDISITE